MFDTLKFARALRDGGQFTPEQAERLSDALSDAISGEVAARADLETAESNLGRKIDDLKERIDDLEARLDRRIDDLEAKLDRRIDDLEGRIDSGLKEIRADLKAEIKGVEAKFEAAKADTIKWVVGIITFQTVAIVGAAVVLARILGH